MDNMHPVTGYSVYKCGRDPYASIRIGVKSDQSNTDTPLYPLVAVYNVSLHKYGKKVYIKCLKCNRFVITMYPYLVMLLLTSELLFVTIVML